MKKIVFGAFMAVAIVAVCKEFSDYQRISNRVDELAAACEDSGQQPCFVLPPYEATQMYMQLAESTGNKLAVAVLKDIADEELVHAGEFLKLLYALAPDEEGLYAKGAGEVVEIAKSQLQQTT